MREFVSANRLSEKNSHLCAVGSAMRTYLPQKSAFRAFRRSFYHENFPLSTDFRHFFQKSSPLLTIFLWERKRNSFHWRGTKGGAFSQCHPERNEVEPNGFLPYYQNVISSLSRNLYLIFGFKNRMIRMTPTAKSAAAIKPNTMR